MNSSDPSALLQKIVEVLNNNKGAIDKDTSEALSDLMTSFSRFSMIDWEVFGADAEAGLERFKGLKDAFASTGTALEGLSGVAIENITALKYLSDGLSSFADVNWSGVTKGLLAMSGMPLLFKIAARGFKAAGEAVADLGKYTNSFEALEAMMNAFKAFADIRWKDVFYGLLAVRSLSSMFPLLGTAIDKLKLAIGSKESERTIKSLDLFVRALDTFGKISWFRVTIGLGILKIFGSTLSAIGTKTKGMQAAAKGFADVATTLGTAIGNFFRAIPFGPVAKGLVLLAGLAIDIGLLAGAFILFGQVDWDAVEAGFWALTMFAAIAALFAVAAEVIAPGILVLAGLGAGLLIFGASLMVVGKGMEYLSNGIKAIGDTIPSIADSFLKMSEMSTGLIKTAAALSILSAAIIAFTAATASSGIVGAVGGVVSGALNFLSKSKSTNPIDQIERLALMSDKLNQTASALERINMAIAGMPSTSGIDLRASNAENAALASRRGMMGMSGAAGPTIKTAAQNITNQASSVVINNSWMPDRSSVLILAPAI
jgi:hypothetical protein